MKNRKNFMYLLVLMGMLMLSGCGNENEAERNETVKNESAEGEDTAEKKDKFTVAGNTEQSGEQSPEEEAQDAQEGQAGETEQNIADIPAITVTSVKKEWYTEDQKEMLFSAESFLVNVENEGFEPLRKTLTERFKGIDEGAYDSLLADAQEHYDITVGEGAEYFSAYSSMESAVLTRCDSKVLSFRQSYSDYTGGAHGMYGCAGITFDVESGKELSLSDILADEDGFYKAAIDYMSEILYTEYGDELFPEYKEYVADAFSEGKNSNWYLDATGIVVIYNPYELGPYSMGMAEVLLPYEEFGEYIDTEYQNTEGGVIAKVSVNKEPASVLGGEGRIYLKTEWNEYDMQNVSIVSGEKEESIGEFGRFCDAYLVKRKDKRSFMFITCDYMSDDYVTLVYEVTEGNIKKCHEVSGARVTGDFITPDKIELSLRLDVLGTYSAKMNYLIDENGNLTQAEDIFTIDSVGVLTVTNPLPVILEGESVLLNTDTQIRITGTNNVNEVYFEVPETKTTGVIYYEMGDEDSWIHMIDGVSEYEYFDALPYAG